ncbi:MAG TPA: tetratricopeptide repeat protein [Bacteroidia bacterium]|nr:tetratricopeptide repeat protein [Bacteroidia bacterium]
MKRFPYSLFIVVFLVSVNCFSQDKRKADSLLTVLKTAEDTQRVVVLGELSYYNRINEPDMALKYADQSIQLADQIHYENGRFNGRMQKGLVFYSTGKYDSALKYFEASRVIAEKINDPSQLAAIYSNIGNVYGDMGQNKKCLEYYLKGDEYTKKMGQPVKAAYMEVNIGTIYSALGQHDSALVFYESALATLKGIDPNDEKLYIVYGNIGASHMEMGDTVKAEAAFIQSHRIALMYDNKRALASSYDHLGIIEFSKGNRDTAFAYLRKSLELCYITESRQAISEVCAHMGELFYTSGQYDSASFYWSKGVVFAEEIKDYYQLDDYYLGLSKVFEATGKIDSALFYYKKLQAVKDTLFNLNKSNIVGEMRTQMENERGQKEIELLKEQDEKKNIILYSSIAFGILILLLGILAFNRYLVKKRSAMLLEKQNSEIQEQKEIIEEKNKDITDSIRYAKRIQNAILPANEKIHELFPQSWCYFLPKDIVSGDFYWFENEGDYKLFGVVDCTGHGVPGALLSVVGHNILGKALTDLKMIMPDKILAFLDEEIHKTLRHKDAHEESGIQDGMDVSLCCYHEKSGTVYYAGAFNPMYIVRQGELLEFKADKVLIGSGDSKNKPFKLHEVKVEKGDQIILFSDGFADQFGGPFGKKLKYKPFQQMLLSIQFKNMDDQLASVKNSFEEWKKDFDQVDDVCVVAVKV